MSEKISEDYNIIENLLGHVPYTKAIPYNTDEFFENFLVYISSKYSLVPELNKILSHDDLLNLLYVFAGQTLEIPEQKAIQTAFRDIDIYISLKKNMSTVEVNRLAEKYSATTQTIKAIFTKVNDILK